jgi:hypothetical protein
MNGITACFITVPKTSPYASCAGHEHHQSDAASRADLELVLLRLETGESRSAGVAHERAGGLTVCTAPGCVAAAQMRSPLGTMTCVG